MHVRVRLLGKPETIVVVDSKLTKIDQFRKLLKEKFDVRPQLQRLFYGGKLLENGYTFHDYNIKLNDVIQLMVHVQPVEETSKEVFKSEVKEQKVENQEESLYEDAESLWFEVGDLVDVKDKEQGAWFEGTIERIVNNPDCPQSGKENKNVLSSENKPKVQVDEAKEGKTGKSFSELSTSESKKQNLTVKDDLLYKIKLESEESSTYYKLQEIRPRARTAIDVTDLQVGQTVMVNHNEDNYLEKGYWHDFKISEIKKLRVNYDLIGTIYLGSEGIPQNDTKVRVHDKIFAIEELMPLEKRSKEDKIKMKSEIEKRSAPLNCLKCRDNEDMPCRKCGCYICSGKEAPDKIILCDECNNGYHMDCLKPPLTELPEEDWYCPSCKLDTKCVVAPGAAKQTKKRNTSKSNRDWGRGMACVGKTKTCTMPSNHFGPIPGIEVGMCWRFRIQLSETGVHRPPVSGIHGRDEEGAYSIVLSGGYEDDVDHGDEFTYTGSGGRDLSGNKRTAEQSCNQTLTRENRALARNCAVKDITEAGGDAGENWRNGKPVRVVRSYKMIKHFPKYAPKEGIRYDGIYKVVKFYPEKGKSGFIVWKYLLRRDDTNPAPWQPDAKEYQIIYPDGYLEAEAEKKALKEQGGKTKRPPKKRAVKKPDSSSEDEENGEEPPPQKKRKTATVAASPETPIQKRGRSKNVIESDSDSPKRVTIPSIFAKVKGKSPRAKNTKEEKLEDGEPETEGEKPETNGEKPETKGKKPGKPDKLEDILSKDELASINEDTLNKKTWDECVAFSKSCGKKDFIDHVTTVFLCIICQDVVANPVTTSCVHNFCMACITLAFKSTGTKSCPCCRRDLSKDEIEPNEKLKAALQGLMPGYDAGKM